MPQSLAAIYIHATWSTKERVPFLRDAGLRTRMFEYIGGVSNNLECTPIIVGGVEDHVHILARFARTTFTADWIKEIKRGSSAWVKDIDADHPQIPMAGGVRRVLRELLQHRPRRTLHRESGSAPPQANISGRVPGIHAQTWDRIG